MVDIRYFLKGGEARRSRRWRGALHTWCSLDRLCTSSRSGGHTSRPRFLWVLGSLP